MMRYVTWLLPLLMVLAVLLLLGACRLIVVAPPTGTESATALDVDMFAQFGSGVDELRKELKIPGLSAAVVGDQEVAWARGFGYADLEDRIPATEDTAYEIASLTTPFAAALLMQRVEADQLELDAVMAAILQDTEFTFPPPADEPVEGFASLCTVIQELSQATSGPCATRFLELLADSDPAQAPISAQPDTEPSFEHGSGLSRVWIMVS